MPSNPQIPPVPGRLATFGQWKAWIDYKAPGEGDKWIAWVQSNAKITPPESATVDLSSNQFGSAPPPPAPPRNYASDWFAAWLLLGNVGPGIGKALKLGLGALGQLASEGLTGTAIGIGKVPGAQGLGTVGEFLGRLQESSTWVRVAEVALGIVLLAIGVARITGTQNAVAQVVKARIP
jgi:hypothetical protein